MLTKTPQETWSEFLEFISEHCSATEFQNWFAPVRVLDGSANEIFLEVPNIFVKEYLLDNYKKDLSSFLPLKASGELAVTFVIPEAKKKIAPSELVSVQAPPAAPVPDSNASVAEVKLNPNYTFENFIEGPS